MSIGLLLNGIIYYFFIRSRIRSLLPNSVRGFDNPLSGTSNIIYQKISLFLQFQSMWLNQIIMLFCEIKNCWIKQILFLIFSPVGSNQVNFGKFLIKSGNVWSILWQGLNAGLLLRFWETFRVVFQVFLQAFQETRVTFNQMILKTF